MKNNTSIRIGSYVKQSDHPEHIIGKVVGMFFEGTICGWRVDFGDGYGAKFRPKELTYVSKNEVFAAEIVES